MRIRRSISPLRRSRSSGGISSISSVPIAMLIIIKNRFHLFRGFVILLEVFFDRDNTVMKKLLGIATILIVFFLWITGAEAARAHKVTSGDNLYNIANHYGVSVIQIKQANKLSSNNLKLGTRLTIPAVKAKKNASVSKTKKTAKKKSSIHARASRNRRPLDPVKDAERMAHDREVVRDIVAVAEIENETVQADEGDVIEETGDAAIEEDVVENITYTVAKGDNLWQIARKNNTTVANIKSLNGMKNIRLKIGSTLVVGHRTVSREESPVAQAQDLREQIASIAESPEIKKLGLKDRVLLVASKMLHIPYRFGGNTFMGIDCSAFVRTVFGFVNLSLPRTAREQFKIGETIDKEELRAGDLVFFQTYAKFPSHVGIYLGDNLFIHASSVARKITVDSLTAKYYSKRFIGARRIVDEEEGQNQSSEQRDSAEPRF